MSNREARENREYPTEDPPNVHEHEGNEPDYEENNDASSCDEASVLDSEAQDAQDAKEAPGVDMRAAPREHSGKFVMIFFLIFSFISFVLMLAASTPVAWYKASNGDQWTLWKNPKGTRWTSDVCQHKAQMFQAMAAFTIAGCVLSLATFVAGVCQFTGSGHMGVSLALCFSAMSMNLVAWALSANQYHKYSCPGEIAFVDKVNRLQAGFSLAICSFGLMFFAFISLGYYFYTYFSLTKASSKKMSSDAVISTFLAGACLCITTVGSCFTMWEDYSLLYKIKVTLWHVEILHQGTGLSEYWSLKAYNCNDLTKMFHAGQAFVIVSCVFLFFTLLLMTASVYNRLCKWAAFGLGMASWVTLLICWAVMVAARYKNHCKNGVSTTVSNMAAFPNGDGIEQSVNYMGFVITEGLGMIISAWAIMTVTMIYYAVKA